MLLFIVSGINAQIALEHTYSFSGTLTEIADSEYKYFVQDVPLNQCRIYNEDHTLFKTVNLSIPGGYYLNDTKFVTKHLFNADDYVEVLYLYYKTMMVEFPLHRSLTIYSLDECFQFRLNRLGQECFSSLSLP